ncbi:MAG: methyl-accepting chemotaxis protein [Methanosarcinaceae archaeon]|nr:methyl-accepting chemotaxis protein [Methanosarcinaceae archaeon]
MDKESEISERERNKLLNSLHRRLFWVGEQIPRTIRLEGKEVNLHEVVWEIVNKRKYSPKDLENIQIFLDTLYEKEQKCEKYLEEGNLTYQEAKDIFNETAGMMRAIMDLQELAEPSKRGSYAGTKHTCGDVKTDEWDRLMKVLRSKK